MSNPSPNDSQDAAADPPNDSLNSQPGTSASDTLACNGCRRAKLRCSRDRPNCLHCRKTGLNCVYETKRVKPGLKSGAVENLHKRLDAIERLVQTQEARSQSNDVVQQDQNVAKNSSNQESVALNILALLAKELPKLVNAQIDRPSPSSSERVENPSKRRRFEYDVVDDILADNADLPSPDALEDVVSAYFLHIHPWIPMIHQAKFRQRADDPSQRGRLEVVLHAMVIAASKFVPDLSLPDAHLGRTRKWLVSTAMDSMCLESLQALTILAFTDIGNGNGAKAWSVIGSLTRTVEYSQITQERDDHDHRPFCQPCDPLDSTQHWTELEERRRVFWNVFNLDRFCNITMGWNTSLTSDDVHRRLPCDGPKWRTQQPVITPYFGIWEKSAARIGIPIAFIPQYQSPGGANNMDIPTELSSPIATTHAPANDMSTVGAFAYCVEATESMSRVTSYFLQQRIDLRNQHEISAWLTRFKELDLRLVHWKMLLPQKWKTNMERQSTLMDPNLTTAHVTHNASMILLHQLIAYPPQSWGFRHRLPSSCSADTCYSAAIEIATITRNYLDHSEEGSPIGSQYAFCVYIAARMLLIHWRYYNATQLAEGFWSLVQSLEEMSSRWAAFSMPSSDRQSLCAKYALKLKDLYEACARDDTWRINVMDYTKEIDHSSHSLQTNSRRAMLPDFQAEPNFAPWPVRQELTNMNVPTPGPSRKPVLDSGDFNTIPQMILDQHFMNMDRVITFDDGSMFTATLDNGAW